MQIKHSVTFLYVYVFITGASVMALEIAASRFLAPYYGTSMVVWANIIGLILLSLSLGYWIGGKWADKRPSGSLLMILSLAAGVLTSLLPLWGGFLFPLLSAGIMNTPIWIIICSFFAVLIVFAPPIFLLAMVSPFAIRLIARETEHVGKIAGNLYACSTLGSLVGTFGTAFVTIPFLGSKETIFIWSSFLIIISVWGLRNHRIKWIYALVFLPLIIYLITNNSDTSNREGKLLWAKDSLYQYIRVIQNKKGDTSLVYNEGGGIQSIHRVSHPLTYDDYYSDYTLVPFLTGSPKQILVLGSAGGSVAHLLATYVKPHFPDLQITGVELDPEVAKLGPRFFGLEPEDATIITQDARVFINHTNERYDVIIVDCYSQQIYVPFHLSTTEFFQSVRKRLTPNGVIAMNVNATTSESRLLASFAKTVHQVFPYTYLVRAQGQYNYMLLGAMNPLTLDQLNGINANDALEVVRKKWPETLNVVSNMQMAKGTILTDNKAPTEMMTDSMIFGEVNK
ncbi:spermidine synthase [Paenibacillus sp. L3-i20]|uniref:spermidine synthase n=1 Tax=Paenibacillus sp. L3-i20 TaxID=2905833 RepID=UPI001EE11149|nr:fused MFS/spermidine synthase [Paenibacillus sp. L3-i20]GKU80094.1 spermidine synthase [Paenibacillus sp. L3-i20]